MALRGWATFVLCAAVTAAAAVAERPAPPSPPEGAVALGVLLRRLETMGTVLVITAHPDDEHNAALVALSRGRGIRTVLLTATRGEGGQNEIGPELGETLGLLRVEELAAIHRIDGVEQRFARAYDFGYSFSVDETFEKWGRDAILDDLVRTIRSVRPDVILTLRREAPGGGQHHQAAARLAALAFRAAADARAFPPASTGGLEPWQTARLYEGQTGMGGGEGEGVATLETDRLDPVLGTTWLDFGGRARTLHRTQGMNVPSPKSGAHARYVLVDSEPPLASTPKELAHGLDFSWHRLATFAGERERPALEGAIGPIVQHLSTARGAYNADAPQETLEPLRGALGLVRRLREEALVAEWSPAARLEILTRVQAKEGELMEAIALAHGLRFDATADDLDVVPGQTVTVSTRITNGGPVPIKIEDVVVQAGANWTSPRTAGEPGALDAAATVEIRHAVRVGSDADVTRPAGRKHPTFERYEMSEQERTGTVFPPPVSARLFFTSGGVLVSIERPIAHLDGAARRDLSVVPRFGVRFLAPTVLVPREGSPERTVEVQVRHFGKGAVTAVCRLDVPRGWTVAPAKRELRFAEEDETQTVRFELRRPPRPSAPGRLVASVSAGERLYREELQDIDYPHVTFRRAVRSAALRAQSIDVRVAQDRVVGYVAGAGDRVPDALEQIGARWTALTADDLGAADLSRFGAIVLGIRAYQTRPDLKRHHGRLLEYMNGGGHVVVQYNKFEFNDGAATSPFAPYPAAVTANRVTDERAPIRFLDPGHPLLNTPNRITGADFEGWVQERGLHFLEARDPRYEDLLATTDPFPNNAGEKKGLLVCARVGTGTWTYVGLGLWRQIDAGVPGAYRILANLVSQPRSAAASR